MFPHHSDQMSQSHLEAISFPRSSFACSVSRFHFSLVDAPVYMFINCSFININMFILCLQWSHLDPRRPFELGGGVPPAVTHILLLQPGDVRELQIYHIISIVAWNIVRKQVLRMESLLSVTHILLLQPGDRSRNDQCPDNVHSITWKSYWSTMYFHGDILLLQPGHVHLWLSWSLRRIVHSITRNCSYCS